MYLYRSASSVATAAIGGKDDKIIIKDSIVALNIKTYPECQMIDSTCKNQTRLKSDSSNDENSSKINTTTDTKYNRKNKEKKSKYDDWGWCKEVNRLYEQSMNTNLNPISFTGGNNLTSTSNELIGTDNDTDALEQPIDPFMYCNHCKQLHNHCHFNVCAGYIQKKLLFLYTNKITYPDDAVISKSDLITVRQYTVFC